MSPLPCIDVSAPQTLIVLLISFFSFAFALMAVILKRGRTIHELRVLINALGGSKFRTPVPPARTHGDGL
jgi:hypothetical protein